MLSTFELKITTEYAKTRDNVLDIRRDNSNTATERITWQYNLMLSEDFCSKDVIFLGT